MENVMQKTIGIDDVYNITLNILSQAFIIIFFFYLFSDFFGYMAFCNTKIELYDVKKTNIVSFYNSSDPEGKNWESNYKNRIITLTSHSGKTFNATIKHTCGDESCNNCCTLWAQGGVLIQLEYL